MSQEKNFKELNFQYHDFQKQALDSPARFILLQAGIQCIEENEIVYRNDGISKAGELKDGDEIIGGTVSGFTKFKSPIYQVVLGNGIKIKLSPEHPLWFRKSKKGAEPSWETVGALFDRNSLEEIGQVFLDECKDEGTLQLKYPKLLGYLLSDGYIADGQSIKFTNINKALLDEVDSIATSNGFTTKYYPKGNGYDLMIYYNQWEDHPIKLYLKELEVTKETYGKILGARKDDLRAFLKGIFNGDGSLIINRRTPGDKRRPTVIIDISIGGSETRAYEMQYILWRLGFMSNVLKERFEGSLQDFYRVRLTGDEAKRLSVELDDRKYPRKFEEVRLLPLIEKRSDRNWLSVREVVYCGEGVVCGWETLGNNQVTSYCGLKTHNSGKTVGGAMWLIQEILRYQGEGFKYDYAIIAPTYKLLNQSTFKKFLDIAPSWLGTWKENKSIFELADGGKIYVRSAEDPDSLEGMTLKAAWLDEAGQMKERVWSIVYGRLNILKGRMIMTTTPYVHCWLDDYVIMQYEEGNKDYEVIQYESIASPWFPIEEYEHAKKVLSPSEFSRRYMGVLVSSQGLVYDGWNKKYVLEVLPGDLHIKEYAAGIDFGYNHPAAIEVGAFSDDFPAVIIVDEWYEKQKTIDELIAAAKKFKDIYGVRIFYADPSRPEYIMQLNHAGIPTMPAKNDVQMGLDKVRALMYTGNLRVLEKCKGLLQERKRYRYPEDTVSGKNEPVKIDDDASDAERYLIASHHVQPTEAKDKEYNDPIWNIIKEEEGKKNKPVDEVGDWFIDSTLNEEVLY